MVSAQQLIDAARSLVGVPYVHQGHSKFGVDCLGFLFVSAEIAGIDLQQQIQDSVGRILWNYGRKGQASTVQRISTSLVPSFKSEPGSVVLFTLPGAKHPHHFGICSGPTLIHANAVQKRVVEHGYRAQWVTWTHSRWRMPGVSYE